ncbi:hypothetical protein SOVF_017340 [Spinacia oleracea]|nr:hypothetical protein SOVF_017340 [Spinacia oleracea]
MESFIKHNLTLIFLIILADTIILSSTFVESCNAVDKEALLQFKRGIEYDSSGQLTTWNPNTDCCTSWNNVNCDANTGRVVKIAPFRPSNPMDLDISIFVNGTISPFLGNLTSLTELDLGHFQQFYLDNPAGIRGPIPPQIGKLSQLTYLSVAQNVLIGSIPASFANLRRLKTLNLSYNRLSGTIPYLLFQSMKSLSNLYLEQNKLSGSIPSSIVNLISLGGLDLTNNSFSSEIPISIGKLKNLTSIQLSYNKFTGKIPDSLSELSQLDTLKLDHNKLTGSIPPMVLNLKKLIVFDVSNNQLSGRIPPHSSSFPASAFSGNVALCDSPLPPCKR